MFTHQLNPWELDVAPDEELPVYEAASAPAYETGTFDEPVVMFHLRQYDRKIQILRAYGTADTSSYGSQQTASGSFQTSQTCLFFTHRKRCDRKI
jgi:hypothetical protein